MKTYRLLVLLILSILVLFLGFKYSRNRVDIKTLMKINQRLKTNITLLDDNIALQLVSEDLTIDPSIRLIDLVGDTVRIDQILNNKNKLVFKFSEMNCETCIEISLNKI